MPSVMSDPEPADDEIQNTRKPKSLGEAYQGTDLQKTFRMALIKYAEGKRT